MFKERWWTFWTRGISYRKEGCRETASVSETVRPPTPQPKSVIRRLSEMK